MAGNKQKIYLLAELEPSRTLAANTLFAGESGVDVEFISMLRTACLKYINDKVNIMISNCCYYDLIYFRPTLHQPSLIHLREGMHPM